MVMFYNNVSQCLDQTNVVGSNKNKYVVEVQKPCHNFGHDVNVPKQMSNETNLKKSFDQFGNGDSGRFDDKKIRPMSDTSPSDVTSSDNEGGRERGYTARENRVPHHQSHETQSPVYLQPQIPTSDRLHHQINEHKPQKEQQDAKWWRREMQQTQSAPFEDIRSVPTYNEYDCSGRCSNNVYDVHNHEQLRGAYHWNQGDNELARNKVIINCCSLR